MEQQDQSLCRRRRRLKGGLLAQLDELHVRATLWVVGERLGDAARGAAAEQSADHALHLAEDADTYPGEQRGGGFLRALEALDPADRDRALALNLSRRST